MGTRLLTILVALAVSVAAWIGAAGLSKPINRQRSDLQLTVSDIDRALPADAVVTNALLGTFRGVAVMALWQRAEYLKNEGRYAEVMQLTDLITTLQPNQAKVWEYASWNTAYNVSVGTHTPSERWMWVENGINQLRDKGIFYNPDALALYRQLSWIYLHKVQGFQDDANQFYKRQVATEWSEILGGEPPLDDAEAYKAFFDEIAAAPESLDEAVAGMPNGEVAAVWARSYEAELNPRRFLGAMAYEWHDFHPEDESNPHICEGGFNEDGVHGPPIQSRTLDDIELGDQDIRDRFEYAPATPWIADETRAAVLAWARKKVISSSPYHMDPARMGELGIRYTPVDWRHPASHSLYWSTYGVDRMWEQYEDRDDLPEDLVNTQRNAILAAQALKNSGRIMFDPRLGVFGQTTDLEWGKVYIQVVGEAQDRFGDRLGDLDRFYGSGLRNFTDGIIRDLYFIGDIDGAQAVKDRMAERFADSEYGARYDKDLIPFIEEDLLDTLENPDATVATVQTLLIRSIIEGLGEGDIAQAQNSVDNAKRIYASFRAQFDINEDVVSQELPPFQQVYDTAASIVLTDSAYPVPPDTKLVIWMNLDENVKIRIWPQVAPYLSSQADGMGFVFETAFKQPAGSLSVEELIRDIQERSERQRREGTQQGPQIMRQ
ncbi:MAG: hypothetical protein AAGD32_11285 [Planctomycetota bacterium]